MTLKTKVKIITPALAKELLERTQAAGVLNRKASPRTVEIYAAAIGVAHSSLNRWELGVRKPTYALQRKFYDYCKNNGITFEEK